MTPMPQSATTTTEVFDLLTHQNTRLVSLFGNVDRDGALWANYILDLRGRDYRVFTVRVDGALPSCTSITPAAAWYERELHEQFGVEIDGHPDLRPLALHPNWPDGVHPMVSSTKALPWANRQYDFLRVSGTGVCEVPVGPVHAGIIEPGHFRFSVVGDTVLHLELHHFYTHKGTEKLFQGAHVMAGPMIAECVSGDNCFAHAVAYCQAVERACRAAIPARAEAIRLIGLEIERLLAHIGDVGALCGDVGFTVPAAYCARLKEALLQASTAAIGTRSWRGIAVPGGMKLDITSEQAAGLRQAVAEVGADFAELAQMVLETPSVQNRFESTGVLKADVARDFAVVGYVARASGINSDVRRDHPYGAYKQYNIEPITYHYGDVLARARVRIDEIAASARLLDEVLKDLPAGAIATSAEPVPDGTAFSAVESPRGELLYWVEVDQGRIARCHIKSPSFQNWPALPHAMPGNIIADFPLINKSFNLSYSGCDR